MKLLIQEEEEMIETTNVHYIGTQNYNIMSCLKIMATELKYQYSTPTKYWLSSSCLQEETHIHLLVGINHQMITEIN